MSNVVTFPAKASRFQTSAAREAVRKDRAAARPWTSGSHFVYGVHGPVPPALMEKVHAHRLAGHFNVASRFGKKHKGWWITQHPSKRMDAKRAA